MMLKGKKIKQKRGSNLAGKLSFNIHTIKRVIQYPTAGDGNLTGQGDKGSFNIQQPAMVIYLAKVIGKV